MGPRERIVTSVLEAVLIASSSPFSAPVVVLTGAGGRVEHTVVEHVQGPAAFVRRLLEIGRTVVISVPYKWRAALPNRADGADRFGHRNHNIDACTLRRWANFQHVRSPHRPSIHLLPPIKSWVAGCKWS
jgi:hypothetical protein